MNWPSSKVRDSFIQYFIRHSSHPHVFVPSSSVVPKNDPSLAFVNAGMNQFKDVILGTGRPAHPRVTNTQKCLRINDLDLVGTDTYHHTFFEMLGNWSFSNYFKKEACEMAWDLLTNVYKLDPARLYVTYFSGDKLCPADMETLEIWKSIGVPNERILPFNKENFWAMRPLGPCGPSTEIHYDHRGILDPTEVNKDTGLVVEIWNLVFMQYNRTAENILERLPLSHVVDTGAGLERLTAVLNNCVSNYDSDLFTPIFNRIQKLSKCSKYAGKFSPDSEIDYAYRVFADHMRATTIALSDGILPQSNHKIRKLLHRSIAVVEKSFLPNVKSDELSSFLGEISSSIATTLSHPFPEIEKMNDEIRQILKVETQRYRDCLQNKDNQSELPILLTSDFPNLSKIPSNDLKQIKLHKQIDGKMAFKWYNSLGVTEEMVEELSNSLQLKFDRAGLHTEMKRVKDYFRDEFTRHAVENEDFKFTRSLESVLSAEDPKVKGGIYESSANLTKKSSVAVEWIFSANGTMVDEIPSNSDEVYNVILTKTSFAPGSNLIQSDIGTLFLSNGCQLNVLEVKKLPSGWIVHVVKNASEFKATAKTEVKNLRHDMERMFGIETSAQALYYFKKWLMEKYGVVRFNEENISTDKIKMEVTLLQGDLTPKDILKCQSNLDNISVPLVVISKEFKKKGVYNVVCATGLLAEVVTRHGCEVLECAKEIQENTQKVKEGNESSKEELQSLLDKLNVCLSNASIFLPYETNIKAHETLREGTKLLSKAEVTQDLSSMAKEVADCVDPFVIKCFQSDAEFSSLKKLSGAASNKPSLILVSSSDGFVQGRCSIPKEMSSQNFTAEQWMNCVLSELGRGSASPPKGQDSKLVVNMKRTRIPELQEKISQAIDKAEQYVNKPFPTN